MPDIKDITTGNQYTGNAALGGGFFPALNLDTKPVEQLAYYTMLFNKTKYDQKVKDTDDKIKQLSQMSSLDLNRIDSKDKTDVIDAYNGLVNYASEYARKIPTNNEEKTTQYLQWQNKLKEVSDMVTSANARYIAIEKRKNDIANDTDPGRKEERMKMLNHEINSTDVLTAIPSEDKYDLTIPQITKPLTSEANVNVNTGNGNVDVKVKYFNPTENLKSASGDVFGINQTFIKPGTPEWDALSPQEQKRQTLLNASKSPIDKWQDAETFFNQALTDPKYKDASGNIDINAIRSSNTILAGIMDLVDRFNSYSTQKQNEIKQGYYTDNVTGKKVNILPGMNEKDFFVIDKSKPLTAEQLVLLQKFQQAAPDVITKDFKYTGESNALKNIQLDYAAQIHAADEATKRAGMGLSASTDDKFGNLLYGVNIYGITGKPGLSVKDGSVIDKNGDVQTDFAGTYNVPVSNINASLISEYDKYAGQPKIDTKTGETIPGTSAGKIDVTGGRVTLRFENGVITGVLTTDGTYADTDYFHHITMKAGQSGVTKYKKPDYQLGQQPGQTTKIPAGATIGKKQ